tara:strand:+ start:103 stop:462 length:360 start_codon:yes stop_codon:yes gene_type:complete
MSEIEIVVSVLVLFMAFMVVYAAIKVGEIKEDIQIVFDNLGDKATREDLSSIYTTLEDLKGQVGYLINPYYIGRGSLCTPSHSVSKRIDLIIEHLNLEIKKTEPSKAVLVKKKPVKKGK